MLSVTELRLGNYISHSNIDYDEVCKLNLDEETINDLPLSSVKPILITESLLVKCGCIKISNHSWKIPAPKNHNGITQYLEDSFIHFNGTGGFNLQSESHYLYLSRSKGYLHELQNLYKMIYDCELDIDFFLIVPDFDKKIKPKKYNQESISWFKSLFKKN